MRFRKPWRLVDYLDIHVDLMRDQSAQRSTLDTDHHHTHRKERAAYPFHIILRNLSSLVELRRHARMPPYIPVEIVDNVIGHLHDHTRSLMNASTVAKAWLPSCRSHLFYCITIIDDREGFEYIRYMETMPGLSFHVRQICLEFRGDVDVEVLVRVLKCFGRLRVINIEGEVTKLRPETAPFPLLHLDFLGVHAAQGFEHEDTPSEGIFNLLLLFSLWHIEELLVTFSQGAPMYVQNIDRFFELQPSTMHVKALAVVFDPGNGLIYKFFQHLLDLSSVSTITVRSLRGSILLDTAFLDLLVALPNLTNLRIDSGFEIPQANATLALSKCLALRSLQLDFEVRSGTRWDDWDTFSTTYFLNWGSTKRILEMGLSHLTNISIIFPEPEAYSSSNLYTALQDKTKWRSLEDCIEHSYPNLEILNIQYHWHYTDPDEDEFSDADVEEYFKTQLARTDSRGLLRIGRPDLLCNNIPIRKRRHYGFPSVLNRLI